MGTEYVIPNLFLEAFGLKVRDSFNIPIAPGPKDVDSLFQGITVVEDINEAFEMSALGTKILFPIRFLEGTYKQYNKEGEIVDKKLGTMRLPIASVISFSRSKLMTTTKINGGRGTVKEIYGFDDWKITINGFFLPDDSQPEGYKTPSEQEKQLFKFENLASSIEVGCELFTEKKIKYLTIESINVEPMRGKPKIRAFTINALSDEPIELNIKSTV